MGIKFSGHLLDDEMQKEFLTKKREFSPKFIEKYSALRDASDALDERIRENRYRLARLQGRVTEQEIASAVVEFLRSSTDGQASIAHLRRELPKFVELSRRDMMPSRSRPSEKRWEQQLRNLVSHRRVPGNAIHEGLLQYEGSGGVLKLTEKGRASVSSVD